MPKIVIVRMLCAVAAFAAPCKSAEAFAVKDVKIVSARRGDVVASAKKELEKHLALVGGWQANGEGLEIVLGKGPEGTPPATNFESHVVYSGGKVYCWGDDKKDNKTPRSGTLFAVYRLLDEVFGVKWVTPDDDGIVFRPMETFTPPAKELFYRPPLIMMTMRAYDPVKMLQGKASHFVPPALVPGSDELVAQVAGYGEWRDRMLLARTVKFQYGHAFTSWQRRFFGEHPDWFGKDPSWGDKASDFRAPRIPRHARWWKLCLSNPAVLDKIIDEWVKSGKPKYFNISPNDGTPGFCRCENCMKLDTRRPGEDFYDHLTDRYLWFWNRLAERAVKLRPDVILVTYVYSYYRHPPRREKIEYPENFLGGLVPQIADDYRKMYDEWAAVGLKHFFIRPNFLCYDAVFPRGLEKVFFDCNAESIRRGAVAVDYDGSRPSAALEFETYAIGRSLSRPDLSFDKIAEEFYSQYGAAAPIAKKYYERVRARGERTLAGDGFRKIAHGVLDDSETAAVSYRGHTPANLAEDFALVRSAPRDGLSAVEKRRLDRLATQIANQRLTLDFLAAGASGNAEKLEAAAKRLYDFRVAHRANLGYGYWKSFGRKSGELKYWKDVKFFRELVPNVKELEAPPQPAQ